MAQQAFESNLEKERREFGNPRYTFVLMICDLPRGYQRTSTTVY